MTRNRRLWSVCLFVVGGWGCGHSEAAGAANQPAAPAAPRPAVADPGITLERHMQLNFMIALDARDAVVEADLPRAQQSGQQLVDLDSSALPEDWRHFTKKLQVQAEELTMAPDLATAAVAIGAIGGACGDCHYTKHATLNPSFWPQPEADLPTQGDEELAVRMKRHAIASDELWAGLTGPSDAFWKRGADTLEAAPFQVPVKDGEPMRNDLGFDVERVRNVARKARVAAANERPAVFGELLAQCGVCHQQVAR